MRQAWYPIVLLPLYLFILKPAFGQTNFKTTHNQIKFSPFKLIDFVHPGVELSFEKQYGKGHASALSVEWMKDLFGVSPYFRISGYRLGLEQKYFMRQHPVRRNYFSAELLYSNAKTNTESIFGFVSPGLDTFLYTYPDTIDVHRESASFNFKVGRQTYKKRFVFDLAIGLGLKYKEVTHANRIAPLDEMKHPLHPNAYYEADRERKYFTITIPLSFKIGYRF